MAKPTPLPLGRIDPHIKQSNGAENYIMNFYVTNYSTSFAKPNTDSNKSRFNDIPAYSGSSIFKPRSAPEKKDTGFTSNVRPQIYYNRTLDNYDNPEMARMCEHNYTTMANIHFQPYRLNDGLEELPSKVVDQTSAFTQKAYNHNPLPKEVHNQFIDTRIQAPYDVLPNHKAKLHHINNHDPISNENYAYMIAEIKGPRYMSTEYKTRFDNPKSKMIEKLNPSVGPKEISGFEDNKEQADVITGTPGERWLFKNRTTGVSDYKDRFLPYEYSRSETLLPNISNLDYTKESTYARTNKPSDVNPRSNKFINNPTEYKETFLGKRSPYPKLAEELNTANVGPKELGGQSKCERGFLQTLDDPRRFITSNQINHYNMTAKGKDREGFVTGGINGNFDDGYVKNRKLHQSEPLNVQSDLYNMDSYQSRSIKAINQFYDDHAHDHKFSVKNTVVTFQDNNPHTAKLI